MATLEELEAADVLLRHVFELDVGEFAERHILMFAEFDEWAAGPLKAAKKDRGKLKPYSQVVNLFDDFIIGRPLSYGNDRRKLDPVVDGVWELKTEDVRVFGWVPRKRWFIAVRGQMKNELKAWDNYVPYVQAVVAVRDALDLDPPKFLTGTTHHDLF